MKYAEKLSVVLLLILIAAVYQAQGSEIVFIGLTGEGAPAIEKSYDQLLRERLASSTQFQTADYLVVQNYKERIDFHRHPVVSKNLLNALQRFAHDSTIFIWGSVTEYRMKPVRRNLIGSFIEAKLAIHLNIYSLSNQRIAFSGEVRAKADKYKGINIFSPVGKVVHISGTDRSELLNELVKEAVRKSDLIISLVLKSDSGNLEASGPEQQQYVPSLYDVFSMPSMEASVVEDSVDEPAIVEEEVTEEGSEVMGETEEVEMTGPDGENDVTENAGEQEIDEGSVDSEAADVSAEEQE